MLQRLPGSAESASRRGGSRRARSRAPRLLPWRNAAGSLRRRSGSGGLRGGGTDRGGAGQGLGSRRRAPTRGRAFMHPRRGRGERRRDFRLRARTPRSGDVTLASAGARASGTVRERACAVAGLLGCCAYGLWPVFLSLPPFFCSAFHFPFLFCFVSIIS